jgi:hypothetical protein
MSTFIRHTLGALGPLRLGLAAMAALTVAAMPAPGTALAYEGWGAFTTLVVPAVAPILVMVYVLDALMALVLMKDRSEPERRRYRWVIATDLAVAALLLASWLPLILALRR